MSIDESFLQGLQAPLQVPQADLPIDMTPYVTALADVKSHEAKIKQLERMQEYSDNLAAKLKKETQDAEYDFEERGLKMAYVSSNPWIRRQWLEKVAKEPLMSMPGRDAERSYYDPNAEAQAPVSPTIDTQQPLLNRQTLLPGGISDYYVDPTNEIMENLPLDDLYSAPPQQQQQLSTQAPQTPNTPVPVVTPPDTQTQPQQRNPAFLEQGPVKRPGDSNAMDLLKSRILKSPYKFDPNTLRTPAPAVTSTATQIQPQQNTSLLPQSPLAPTRASTPGYLSYQGMIPTPAQRTLGPSVTPTATQTPPATQQANKDVDYSFITPKITRDLLQTLGYDEQQQQQANKDVDHNFLKDEDILQEKEQQQRYNQQQLNTERDNLIKNLDPRAGRKGSLQDNYRLPTSKNNVNNYTARQRNQINSLAFLNQPATQQQVQNLRELSDTATEQRALIDLRNKFTRGQVSEADLNAMLEQEVNPADLGMDSSRALTYGNLRQKALDNRENFAANARLTQDPNRLRNLKDQGFTPRRGLDKRMYPALRSPIQRRISGQYGIQNTTPQELRQQIATGTLNPRDLEAAYKYYESGDFAPTSTKREAANIDQFANMLNTRQAANTQADRILQNRLNNPTLLQRLQDNIPYFSNRDELQKEYDALKKLKFKGQSATDTPFGRFETKAQEDARYYKELDEEFKRQERAERAQSLAPLLPTRQNIKLIQGIRGKQKQKPAQEQNFGAYFRGLPARAANLGYDMLRPITTGAQQLASYALENPNLRGLVDPEQRDLINASLFRLTGDDTYRDRYERSHNKTQELLAQKITKGEVDLVDLERSMEEAHKAGYQELAEGYLRDINDKEKQLEKLRQQQLNSPSLVGEGSDQAFYNAAIRPQMAFMNDLLGVDGANETALQQYKTTTEGLLRDSAGRYYQNPTYSPYREARTIAGNLVTDPKRTLRQLARGLNKDNPLTPLALEVTAPEDLITRVQEETGNLQDTNAYMGVDNDGFLRTESLQSLEDLKQNNPQLVADIINQYNPRVISIMNELNNAKTVEEQQAIMNALSEADIAQLTKQLSLLKDLFPPSK